MTTTDTPSSRDEDIPTPSIESILKIASIEDRYLPLLRLARTLQADLIRLSAERETERGIYRLALGYQSKGDFEAADKILATLEPDSKAPTHRDINDIELIDDLKRTLAERDKELAEVKRDHENLRNIAREETERQRQLINQGMEDFQSLRLENNDLRDQLLAAQTVNAKMRVALQNILKMTAGHYGIEKAANDALAPSPDPTLLDEVVKGIEEIRSKSAMVGYDGGHAGICAIAERLLSRLRQSTRETEEKV